MSAAQPSRLLTVPAADVQPSNFKMIWRDRLPSGTISVVAGLPGLGKSTLSTTIAAELSREGIAGIISNREDELSAVVRPRLEVAKADLDLVHLLPFESSPELPQDLNDLEMLIRDLKAGYIILDPMAAHFTSSRTMHNKKNLAAIIRILRATDCALVAIHHTTKGIGRSAIELIGGEVGGLSGVARAVYLYGNDPEDRDRRALACVKINGMDSPSTLVFEHFTVEYRMGGKMIEAGKLKVCGQSNAEALATTRQGKRNQQKDAECVEWLTKYLLSDDDCRRRTMEIQETALKLGFTWQGVLRAAITLEVRKLRVGEGEDALWFWRLPDEHPLRLEKSLGEDVGSGQPV